MATDQQALPIPPNPNPTAPAADPTPPSASASAARKLPIKRRSPRPSSSPPSSSSPASSDPLRLPPSSAAAAGSGSDPQQQQQPPFKFQRIWSESDELRFLQGLLGCGAQGLVFPRDLNVFYDRFSESMPQPYTRAQLSEKLRRLKNKFKGMAARVAGGLDPARLAPHDRDVLHLCSRLWDPANAATSPFAPAAAGASGNKRRRANPQGAAPLPAPDAEAASAGDTNSHDYNNRIGSSAPPGLFRHGSNGGEEMFYLEQENHEGAALVPDSRFGVIVQQQQQQPEAVVTLPNGSNGNDMNVECKMVVPCSSNEHRMANAVLDVFEECLREAKGNGIINVNARAEETELARRWRAQRMDELDVLSRRLRLLVEYAAAAGQ